MNRLSLVACGVFALALCVSSAGTLGAQKRPGQVLNPHAPSRPVRSEERIPPEKKRAVDRLGSGAGKTPAPRRTDFWEWTNGPEGVFCNVLAYDASGSKLYIGTSDGIYSTSGGAWTDLSSGLPVRGIKNALVVSTSGDVYTAPGKGLGVYKYSGGVWSAVGSIGGLTINVLAISPGGDLYAGTSAFTNLNGGLYKYNTGTSSWDMVSGATTSPPEVASVVFPSTGHIFAGTNINGIYDYDPLAGGGPDWSVSTTDMSGALAINSSDDIFASAGFYIGLYKYNGASWSLLPNYPGLRGGVLAVNSADHVFAGSPIGLYRSDDGGNSWLRVNTGASGAKFARQTIVTNGTDVYAKIAGRLYSSPDEGGTWNHIESGLVQTSVNGLGVNAINGDIHLCTDNGELYRSQDNGTTWILSTTFLATPVTTFIAAPQGGINGYMFAGGPGTGVFRSMNGGAADWLGFSDGLTNGSVYSMAVSPGGRLYAATEGGLFSTPVDHDNWVAEGAGTDIEGTPCTSVVINAGGDIFVGNGGAQLFRSMDGGTTWQLFDPQTSAYYVILFPNGHLFSADQEGVVSRSVDNGDTWVSMTDVPAGINAMAVAPGGDLFASTPDGDIVHSVDEGANWTLENTGLPGDGLLFPSLAVGRDGIAFAGSEAHGVYRSTATTLPPPSISGNVFEDNAHTCNPAQPPLKVWGVKILETGQIAYTNNGGEFEFRGVANGTYNLTLLTKPHWTVPCSPSTVSYTGTPVSGQNFGVVLDAGVVDGSVAVGGGQARPGRKKTYGILAANLGSVSITGDLVVKYPDQVTYSSSTPAGTNSSGTHTVSYPGFTLSVLGVAVIQVVVDVPPIPTVNLGDLLTSKATWTITSGTDVNPANNEDVETQVVRGAFDPNDKLVTPQGAGPFGIIGKDDTLRYHVNFQNTGNDSAFDIVILDTLDSGVDLATFEPGSSSHAYSAGIDGSGIVTFTFANIMLPDSNVDEPGSHGFVEYKVVPSAGIEPGADIVNRAGIYFDFNPVVATNAVQNRIGGVLDVAVHSRWNLLSNPMTVANDSISVLCPTAVPPAFRFDTLLSAYETSERLVNGSGYWLKFGSDDTVRFVGVPLGTYELPVDTGWNLIGSIGSPVATGSVQSDPAGIIESRFFGYDGGYFVADSVAPGRGYWVKTKGTGKLTLDPAPAAMPKSAIQALSSSFLRKLNSIIVKDAAGFSQRLCFGAKPMEDFRPDQFAMPPSFPQAMFDARFESQRMVELLPEPFTQPIQFPVSVVSRMYPITVRLEMAQGNAERVMLIQRTPAGAEGAGTLLQNGGSVLIQDPGVKSLLLSVEPGDARVPSTFALYQNYPNPFNPSASIRFDLPAPAVVTLKIYDLLGREVATLADHSLYEAGTHRLEFTAAGGPSAGSNGGSLASGMYLCRMSARGNGRTFTDVKKMLLMK